MTLVVLSVAACVLFTAVLSIYLFATGILLNRTADNLDDCLRSLARVSWQAGEIIPAVGRLNRAGKDLMAALPLLHEDAEHLVSKSPAPVGAPSGLGYMDVVQPAVPATAPVGVGYLDK